MEKQKIDRINELYKKQKSVGLTNEEKLEQKTLRQEYLKLIRKNFTGTLNNISIKDEKGKITPLRKRK